MAKNAPTKPATSKKEVKTVKNQSVRINAIRCSAMDATKLVIELEENEFVPDGVVTFKPENAKAQLTLLNIPFNEMNQARAVGILADMASTAEPCSLQFDVVYGIEGESYTTRKGETRKFTKTGINVINERIVLSASAIAYRNRQQEKLDALTVNGFMLAQAQMKAEADADKIVLRKGATADAVETEDEDEDETV